MNKKEIIRILCGIVLMIVLITTGIYILKDSLIKMGYKSFIATEKDCIKAAQHYMKKKYGEKFEGEFYYEDSIYSHPVNHPEWKVIIDVEIEKGRVYFHDNYVGFLKKAELESYIYELIKPIYGECKVYTRPHGFALNDDWNRDTDLMTYAKEGGYATYIFTYGDVENKEEDFKRLCNVFLDEKIYSGSVGITYLSKTDFDKFEEKAIDYTDNSRRYYFLLYAFYESKEENRFSEISILKGADNYGE